MVDIFFCVLAMEADDNFQTGLPVPMRGSEGKIGIDFDLETYLLSVNRCYSVPSRRNFII